jgi:CubicO group peptidase (beta-lactamase class C family)
MLIPSTPMMKNGKTLLLGLSVFFCLQLNAQLYFPPNTGAWDTVSPTQLGWCTQELDTLQQYLEKVDSKSFIVLHKGKIAVEWYFDDFTQDSVWYWASAAKSLVAFMLGQLQENNQLSIQDMSSDYLGQGWTACPTAKEALITVEHQLSMTTGLDYQVPDLDCTLDTCLQYRADAGTQWFYHNAPYLLLRDLLEQASGRNLNLYTFQEVAQPIGMQGLWFDNLYLSNARSMARFGLLNLNNGVWNGNTLLGDQTYLSAMKNSSQSLNPAYGYLWWLNGKASFRQPGLTNSFNGPIIPAAPADLYMAAGKNDQRIYIVPSMELVVVRQGEAAGIPLLALSGFDDELWRLLSAVICLPIGVEEGELETFEVYPNPASEKVSIKGAVASGLLLYNVHGQFIQEVKAGVLDVSDLPGGLYLLSNGMYCKRLVVE